MKRVIGMAGLLALALLAPSVAVAAGGTIVKATGAVTVERNGQVLPGSAGMQLTTGDTLQTDKGGGAQVRFDDDSVFVLPGGSALKVDEYRRPRQGVDGRGLYSLLRGGFRTITGLIGRSRRDVYQVRTGVATIGIRGTAYSAVLCAGDLCGAKGRFKDGLYVKVDNGIVIVTNAKGEVTLRANETAFVESAATAPVRVQLSPFVDPQFEAQYAIDVELELDVQPPRVEPDPPASPS